MRQAIPLPLLLLVGLTALAQQPPTGTPSEKIYLHTDRAEYVAGETVWLRAYLTEAARHTPAAVSQTVHLNLLSPTGRVVDFQTLQLAHGSANGQFRLPDTLRTGTYSLVAHTQWMRNFDEAFFFRKTLTVWGRNAQPLTSAASVEGRPDLQFFPEGGHMVSGLLSRVAFKALDASGHGLAVRGRILDDLGQPVTEFGAAHQGMGLLTLTPQPQRRYHALVEHRGQTLRYDLPTPLSEGHVLTVDNLRQKTGIVVQVASNQPRAGEKLHLFAHLRGQQVFEATLDGGKAASNLLVPAEALPGEGIVHVTLFDGRHRPLAERLVYAGWGQQQLGVQVEADRAGYGPRQAVTLTVQTTDEFGQPKAGRLSLAVTDGSQVSAPKVGGRSLPSYLLLESDVKGHVDQPGYYFDSTNTQARLHLDYLLMSQGWRRFTWQEVLSEAPKAPKFLPERGVTLWGRAFRNKKPAGKTELKVTLKTGGGLAQTEVVTDAEGRFTLPDLPLSDSTTVVVDSRDNRYVRVEWEPRFTPAFHSVPAGSESRPVYNTALLEKSTQARQQAGVVDWLDGTTLAEVKVRARKLDPLKNDYRRMMYAGEPDVALPVDGKIAASMPNIFWFINGRVAGLLMMPTKEPGVFTAWIRNGEALLLLDGIPVDARTINQLNPNDVEVVDVLNNPGKTGIFGARGSGGVINFITKRGPDLLPVHPVNELKTTGYQAGKTFAGPDYGSNAKELPGVTVRGRKADPLKNDLRRAMYAGEPDVSLPTDDKIAASMPNIFMFLQGRVAGLDVLPTVNPREFRPVIRGGGGLNGPALPLLLLDGNEIDLTTANQLNPRDIETTDILKNGGTAGVYGVRAGGGVINFITKRGDSPGAIPARREAQSNQFTGYATAREFYSPRYETTAADKPDFRPTLYWNPDVQTDTEGKAIVTFYTSDAVGTLHVVAEGLTDDGKAGHAQTQIQVTPQQP